MSVPMKFTRCANPPSAADPCSTTPRAPKSCNPKTDLPGRVVGCCVHVSSKIALQDALSVATVVGYQTARSNLSLDSSSPNKTRDPCSIASRAFLIGTTVPLAPHESAPASPAMLREHRQPTITLNGSPCSANISAASSMSRAAKPRDKYSRNHACSPKKTP